MDRIELIRRTSSGVVQIFLVRDQEKVGSGSGFLVDGGVVTNNHVVRSVGSDVLAIRFADTDPQDESQYIRVALEDVIRHESPEEERDYAFLAMSEPEFEGRHRFEFSQDEEVEVGQEVVFQGFPFGRHKYNLTSHIGWVSSRYEANGVKVIQIDGSVNGGNSGGPLLSLDSGEVIGIVTRAEIGLIEEQFNELVRSLRGNIKVLSAAAKGPRIQMGRIDVSQGLLVSHVAMERIAISLRQSANVGIGYALSSEHIRDRLMARAHEG